MDSLLSRRSFVHALAATGFASGCPAATCGAEKAALVIDPHVHVWKSDARYPWAAQEKSPPQTDALPNRLLRLMNAHGVDKTILVHYIGYRWDCRYTGDVLKAHPDRFQGVCRVDPTADRATEDLSHWVRDYGFHGVRLSPGTDASGDWIKDLPRMDRLLERAASLRVPVCLWCGVPRLPDVTRLVERYHERLYFCIDHMADCPVDQPTELKKLLALARFPRVVVKISHLWSLSRQAYPYRDTHEQVRRVYDAFGPQRLMAATDWPLVERHCSYEKALDLYRGEIGFFTSEDRRWILRGTARKLWSFA
jgi:L-fuconolactonase